MAMSYESTEVIQRKVVFKSDDGDKVQVVLTKFYGWELTISGRKTLTIGELKEILILLYSKKIIEDDDTIILCLKGLEKIYIHGNRSIESALFGGIMVEVVDTNGKK